MNGQNEFPLCDHFIRAHKLCLDLYNIMLLIHSAHDAEEIVHEIMKETCKVFRCEWGGICIREGEKWVVRYASTLPDRLMGRAFTDEELPHAAIAMLTKEPFAIDDALDDERTNTEMIKALGIRSARSASPIT